MRLSMWLQAVQTRLLSEAIDQAVAAALADDQAHRTVDGRIYGTRAEAEAHRQERRG